MFLDIETVPEKENWSEVPKTTQVLFAKKTAYQRKEAITPEDFYERAGIWAEFGKIICISVAYFTNDKQERNLRLLKLLLEQELLFLQQTKERKFYILMELILRRELHQQVV